jgi:glutathione S-transferase
MKLYHSDKSRSTRVLWLLEELGLKYEIERLPFDRKALQSVDYLQLNPFGKVPVLVDGAVTMFESVAIIQYLLNRYGDGRFEPPIMSPQYGEYLQWMHFGESTLMGPVAQIAQHALLLPPDKRSPEMETAGRRAFAHYARELEKLLAERKYLVGDEFTAADIVMGYTLAGAQDFGAVPEECTALKAYIARLKERPAYQKAAGIAAS